MNPAATLFARHLDLGPLRGRGRGVVKCIFHRERTASLSVDLDRGVFHCFGCGEQGGARRFAELVGETAPAAVPSHLRHESALQQARREVMQLTQRRRARWMDWEDLLASSAWIGQSHRAVQAVRQVASELGESDRVWSVLERAARQETLARWAEAELDAVFAEGRVA